MNASKLSIFTILLLLSASIKNAYSQENFQAAKVFTLSGDTLKGFIDYRNWGKNPQVISFKESENSVANNYKPLTIKGFNVNNELYVGAIVEAEASPYNMDELNTIPDIIRRTDTTFLRVMIQGAKNLYLNIDKKGKEQFYINQWPNFELLVYKKYLKNNEPNQQNYEPSLPAKLVKENKNYLGQLFLYFQDCPSIQPMLKNTEYKQSSLFKLFEIYANCKNLSIEKENPENNYKYSQDKVKFKIGVLAGISTTKLILSSSLTDFQYLTNADYPVSINFSGGMSFNVVLPRNQGKYSVYNELLLSSFSTSAHFEDYHNENYYTMIDTQIGHTYLKLNSMFRYKFFVKNDWFLFANVGLSYGQSIKETNSKTSDIILFDQHTVTEVLLWETKKYEIGYLAGIGCGYKKYSFDVRYERGDGMSGYSALSSTTNRFYFLMGYRF